MNVPWRPLFSGDTAAQALGIVQEIAAATSSGAFDPPSNVHPTAASAWQNSLDGLAGQSLLHAYLAFQGAGDSYSDTAIDLLDQATDAAATLRLTPSLYFGFSGIGWVTTHLAGRLFEESEDSCLEIDEILLGSLARLSEEGKYDLFEGLVGLGAYALERLPRRSAVSLLEAVVAHLAARAEHTPEGACFFNSPTVMAPSYGEIFPRGTYNLGMAHGASGVIALLGSVCQVGIATEQARPLLKASVSWLLARERPAGSDFLFPNTYTPESPGADRSRLSWCHGDLGVATALLLAARGAGEASWESAARRIALVAATRSIDDPRVADAELCHGSAGIGHIFNRLYQATGEAPLGEAARSWLSRALVQHEPGLGIGGYRMSQAGQWLDQPGFRIGSSGVGLALLASVSSIEPAWDRLLLASSPAPRAPRL
jgi:lantibiotic modifying enzyme